ncbi:SusC/RagA family TonB-linked outer membrane protein [Flavobacterium pedocola]
MKNFSFHKGWSRLWYSFILGMLFTCSSVRALAPLPNATIMQQTHQVSGTITNTAGTLPGASVTIKGKTTGTMSDIDGKYQIAAAVSDTLVISFIGYKPLHVPVNGRSVINVQLQDNDATQLQEVVVNAGYYSVKEKERTGSIAKISSKDIEKQPVTNVLAAMQGRMAGVSVTQTTGVMGGGFDIQIRGINSLRANGNQPLYVIDGVPYSSDPIGTGITSPVLPTQPSPLNSINPDQIESIEILKDADATAIYGSRGANGVVLITTKKGKQGKTRFSANVSSGIGTVTKFVDLMNTEQYLQMRREAFVNDGISPYPFYAYDVNGTWDQTRYTDWQKELLGKNASFTSVQGSISGGNASTQFLVSANYNKQTTVFPGDFGYKKGNVHVNLSHESDNKRFKINFSAGYTAQNNNQPGTDPTLTALSLAPNAPALYDSEGNLNWENSTWNNPLADFKAVYTAKTYDLIANTLMSYKLTNNLEFKSSFGFTDLKNNDTNISPSTRYDPAYGLGSEYSTLFTSQATRKSWIIEPQLTWGKQFTSSKLDVLVGTTFQSQKGNQLVQLGIGFPSNSLIYNLASASTLYTIGSEETVYKYQAFFGRINYNWKDRYIVNITGRRDGSSRFGPGKQFANFGAIGGAWLFSEEGFLDGNSSLSFGKLRASYGITGNDQIGDYQYLDTYASTGAIYQGTIGLEPTRLFNPDFGWETNKKFEIALETGFLNDRIFLTTAWYNNSSSNQLVGIPLPGTTGFTSLQANLDATVQNRGLELSLRTVNFQNKNFGWTTNINFTKAGNKLLSFPDLENSTYRNQFVIGQPLNIQKVYHFTGVNPQTGLYEFEDVNGDGILSAQDDKQIIKDFNPDFFGGVQNQFRYKELQLDFLFQFVKQLNWSPVVNTSVPGMLSNQPAEVANHWQSPSNTGTYQIYTDGSNGAAVDAFYRYIESDAAVVDASYIRLKNISLSWDVPGSVLKNVKCRIYIQGQNLLTFTPYKGADPEFKSSGYLPPLKVWTTGMQFSF